MTTVDQIREELDKELEELATAQRELCQGEIKYQIVLEAAIDAAAKEKDGGYFDMNQTRHAQFNVLNRKLCDTTIAARSEVAVRLARVENLSRFLSHQITAQIFADSYAATMKDFCDVVREELRIIHADIQSVKQGSDLKLSG